MCDKPMFLNDVDDERVLNKKNENIHQRINSRIKVIP